MISLLPPTAGEAGLFAVLPDASVLLFFALGTGADVAAEETRAADDEEDTELDLLLAGAAEDEGVLGTGGFWIGSGILSLAGPCCFSLEEGSGFEDGLTGFDWSTFEDDAGGVPEELAGADETGADETGAF